MRRTRVPSLRFALLLALVLVSFTVASGTAMAVSPSVWDLKSDFRAAPQQANPNPDRLGNPAVWYFMQSASLAHDPSTYTLLPEFITNRLGIDGLESWQSSEGDDPTDRLPQASLNTRLDNPSVGGLDWPAGTVAVHPLPDRMAVVGWRSPVTGVVNVSGGVIDRQTICGDGIDWSIDRGPTRLASGSIPNGGSATFPDVNDSPLTGIHVASGDFLYFTVGPGPNGDHTCDWTGLDVTITAVKTVPIDVKPGSSTNPIELPGSGSLPVAILSTSDFNALTADMSTMCFGDAEAPQQRDCSVANRQGEAKDVNGDHRLDLVVTFELRQTGIDLGDKRACLTGKSLDGVPIAGCDAIKTFAHGLWHLESDFRAAPQQANPNPDRLGNPAVWYFMQSASLAHDPSTYTLLPEFITNRLGIDGLESWQSSEGDDPTDRLPQASLNTRLDNPSVGGLDWPAGTVVVHPLPDRMAVVGWRSPVTGVVNVSGGVIDRQTICGDGIDWSIDRGPTRLASGSIPNGGSATFPDVNDSPLTGIHVASGDFLYFTVGPGPNGDHTCDWTGLDVTITAVKTVPIDVKPGSSTNPIELPGSGSLPVAILSTSDFNALTADMSTMCFGDAEAPQQRDCSVANRQGEAKDVNGDHRLDLVVTFELRQTGIDLGDKRACLTGKSLDGVPIAGCDAIKMFAHGLWHLESDFGAAPQQANPNPDRLGNPRCGTSCKAPALRTIRALTPSCLSSSQTASGSTVWNRGSHPRATTPRTGFRRCPSTRG